MITGKSETQHESTLAESCRIALERSYGMAVPIPKCLSKKHVNNK